MSMFSMAAGTCIADRFVIGQTARFGGMGMVFQARDLHTDQLVAIKLLNSAYSSPQSTLRLTLEAQMLASLQHPGIVSYISHGRTQNGQPFLAMEWLEGEDLSQRLRRQTLTLRETLTLARAVAAALAVAHRSGIIHRDLKPSNLFLRDGQIERVTLVDFGIARDAVQWRPLTNSGAIIGTPEYMAPERVRGLRDITASADIYSLGCVLFECLTGQPPFGGGHLLALLNSILREDAPQLRTQHLNIPEPVERLIASMLAKSPAQRPPDGAALLEALEALNQFSFDEESPSVAVAQKESARLVDEQQLFCLINVSDAATKGPELEPETDLSERATAPILWPRADLLQALAHFEVHIEWLSGDHFIVLPAKRIPPTEQAILAARCALFIKARWPQARVELATGCGAMHGEVPAAAAIEEVVAALQTMATYESAGTPHADGILLSEVTARLVETRFEVARLRPGLYLLQSEREQPEAVRRLLGVTTPCVGRERELAMLEAVLSECRDDSIARAVLLIARPGIGKSRLLQTFLDALPESHPDLLVLFARGETQLGDGCLLGQALRRLCGVLDSDSPQQGRAKVAARVAGRLPAKKQKTTAEFLAELCGIPAVSEEDESNSLRAARRDSRVMDEQMSSALLHFLRAECAVNPILVVLEDLQWGDPLSVQLIDQALRELTDCPLTVLALSRPELSAHFPKIWCEHRLQEHHLQELSPEACARLCRDALGAQVAARTVERLVEQSGGNALYLEELIRAEADGRGDQPPPALMAFMQEHLLRLTSEARRVLRAGSILGQSFRKDGVRALLGNQEIPGALEHLLQILVDEQVLVKERHSASAGAGVAEYRFRLALQREAVYRLLTPEDRALGHYLAYEHLRQFDRIPPEILAEHAFSAGHAELAAQHYAQAIELAYVTGDPEAAERHSARAAAKGISSDRLNYLRTTQA